MEPEEEEAPTKTILLALGAVGILVIVLVAAALVVPLQPALGGNNSLPGGTVIMPSGVGSNTKLNFYPDVVTVIVGQNNTVTFQNRDTVTHTVTAADNAFNSGDIKAGSSWTYTFTSPGNFSYYCIYHSAWMRGTVVVKSGTVGGGFVVNIPPGTGSGSSLNYSPSSMTLVAGVNNTITFLNQDTVTHTVTSLDGSFDSGDIPAGGSWTYTFAAGTYSFHCIYHSYMKGTITVISP